MRRALASACALAAISAGSLFLRFHDVGLGGWDTYPLIESSRVRGVGDLVGLFRSSLMGHETGGLYYRPIVKLVFSLEHALWGVWGPGYQLVDALCFGAAALAVYALAARLLPGSGRLAALAALVFFVLHPVHATVVPVPSRRADVLCVLFMCCTLAVHARAVAAGRRLAPGTALLTALALLSKETAFLLVALVPLLGLLASKRTGLGSRLREAILSSVGVVVVAGGVLGLRAAVLGSVAGERPFHEGALLPAALAMAGRVARGVLTPPLVDWDRDLPVPLVVLLSAFVLAAFALAPRAARRAAAAAALPSLVVGLAWLGGVTLTYTLGILWQPWYALIPVVATALLVCGLVAGLGTLCRPRGSSRRPLGPALAGLGCGVLLLAQLAAYSPLVRRYDEWRMGREIVDRYLGALARDIEAARPGSQVRGSRPPPRLPGRRTPRLDGVTLLAPYSVEAWARLAFPAKRIRFVVAGRGDTRPRPDEVLVVLGGWSAGRPDQGR